MSWTLLETTDTGYKKWRDQYGNNRYQAPDGTYTNQQAWGGTHSQGATSSPEWSGTVTTRTKKTRDYRDDLGSYEQATDIVYDEPYEDDYAPPIEYEGVQAYPIGDYPSTKRLDMLVNDIEDNPVYDHYSLAVVTAIVADDGEVLDSGERHTNLLPSDSIPQIRAEWANMMDELAAAASNYSDVLIFKSKAKMREYQEEYK